MGSKRSKGCSSKFDPFGDEENIHPEAEQLLEYLGLNGQPLIPNKLELECVRPVHIIAMMATVEDSEEGQSGEGDTRDGGPQQPDGNDNQGTQISQTGDRLSATTEGSAPQARGERPERPAWLRRPIFTPTPPGYRPRRILRNSNLSPPRVFTPEPRQQRQLNRRAPEPPTASPEVPPRPPRILTHLSHQPRRPNRRAPEPPIASPEVPPQSPEQDAVPVEAADDEAEETVPQEDGREDGQEDSLSSSSDSDEGSDGWINATFRGEVDEPERVEYESPDEDDLYVRQSSDSEEYVAGNDITMMSLLSTIPSPGSLVRDTQTSFPTMSPSTTMAFDELLGGEPEVFVRSPPSRVLAWRSEVPQTPVSQRRHSL